MSNLLLVLASLRVSGLILIEASLSFPGARIATNVPNCVIRFNGGSSEAGRAWQEIHRGNPPVYLVSPPLIDLTRFSVTSRIFLSVSIVPSLLRMRSSLPSSSVVEAS